MDVSWFTMVAAVILKNDPSDFEIKNNLSPGLYHQKVKPKVLSQSKLNYKVGLPDIMLNKRGDIAYQGANGYWKSKRMR